MGKSQKRKCKRLTVHLTYFGGKQMKTQLPLFTFKTPQIWDKGSTRYWWPVKKWALCCKADGKGRLAATRESNPLCCPRRGPDTARSPRSTSWRLHVSPERCTQGQSPRNCLQMLKTVEQGNLYSLNRFSKTHVSKKAKTQCTFYVEKSLTLIKYVFSYRHIWLQMYTESERIIKTVFVLGVGDQRGLDPYVWSFLLPPKEYI